MKCQNYKDYAHKVVYPGYVQPKLNGIRVMIDKNGQAWSKAGEPYTLPKHLQIGVDILAKAGAIPHGLDCEAYAGLEADGGLSLQQIVSAFRKPNENTGKLQLWIYDIPVSNIIFGIRNVYLDSLFVDINKVGLRDLFVIVEGQHIYNEEDYDQAHKFYTKRKFEGTVFRNEMGVYEFGKRSYDVMKRKDRQDTEARVLSVTMDKNGQGVLNCELENGVQVECLMLKEADPDINYRLHENALTLIQKFIKLEFEEFSDKGVPTKPVGIALRDVKVVDGKWVVLE
jgi:ATP-dependent DNA ligase